MVEQIDLAGIHLRQQIAVEIALGERRDVVSNAELAERLAAPLPAVTVACDARDIVALEQGGKLVDYLIG